MNFITALQAPQITEAFFRLLQENTGIDLDISKEYLLPARLNVLAKQLGSSSLQAFLENLIATPVGPVHWRAFEAMTTNETMFFRDQFPFEALRENILPGILARKQTAKELNIWCAAASSGQEPFSLSILLKETFPELSEWHLNFLATDISDQVLIRAQEGVYSDAEVNRGLSKEQIFKNFSPYPGGRYQINQEMRSLIKFSKLNLIKEWPVMPKFDLVLMRNVLIYFNQDIKSAVLKKMAAQLADGGVLLLGTSESLFASEDFLFERYQNLRFYKKG